MVARAKISMKARCLPKASRTVKGVKQAVRRVAGRQWLGSETESTVPESNVCSWRSWRKVGLTENPKGV
jgi:hypothetical protein